MPPTGYALVVVVRHPSKPFLGLVAVRQEDKASLARHSTLCVMLLARGALLVSAAAEYGSERRGAGEGTRGRGGGGGYRGRGSGQRGGRGGGGRYGGGGGGGDARHDEDSGGGGRYSGTAR